MVKLLIVRASLRDWLLLDFAAQTVDWSALQKLACCVGIHVR